MAKNIFLQKSFALSLLIAPFIVSCSSDNASDPVNNVTNTKDFVADARTWGTVINNETQTPDSELDMRATTAGQVFDTLGPVLGAAMQVALDAAGKAYVSGVDVDLSTLNSLLGDINPITAVGTATISGNTVTVAGTVTSLTGITFDINGIPSTPVEETADVNLVLGFPDSLNASSFTIDVTSGTATTADATMTISDGTATLNYGQNIDITPWVSGANTIDPFPSFDDASMVVTISISETRSDPVSFEGTLQFDIIGAQENGVVKRDPVTNDVVHYNPDNMLLSGRFGTGSSYFSAEFSASVPNADTFFPLMPVYVAGNVYDIGQYVFSNAGNTVTISIPEKQYMMVFNNGDPANPVVDVTTTYNFDGTVLTSSFPAASLLEFLASTNNPLIYDTYLWVAQQGTYSAIIPANWDVANGGVISGTLLWADYQPEEDASNFIQIQNLKIEFIAQLAGLPQARFTIEGNRTEFQGGNASVTVVYGNRSLKISASTIANGEAEMTITVTNREGDILLITFNSATGMGEVRFNGELQATLEQDALGVIMITYNDGSFESLM